MFSIQYISSVYSPIYKFPPNFVSLITRDRLILVYFSLEENTGHVFCLKYGLTSLHTPGLALQLRFLSELYVVHTLYIYTWVYLTRGIFPLSPSFGGAGGGGMYSLLSTSEPFILVELWRINTKEYTYITRKRDSNIPSS